MLGFILFLPVYFLVAIWDAASLLAALLHWLFHALRFAARVTWNVTREDVELWRRTERGLMAAHKERDIRNGAS